MLPVSLHRQHRHPNCSQQHQVQVRSFENVGGRYVGGNAWPRGESAALQGGTRASSRESAAPAAPKKTGGSDRPAIQRVFWQRLVKGAQRGPQSVEDVVKSAEADGKKPAVKPKIELPPVPRKEDFLPPKPVPVAAEATDRRGFFSSTVGVLFGAPLAVGFTSMAITSLLWVLGLLDLCFRMS